MSNAGAVFPYMLMRALRSNMQALMACLAPHHCGEMSGDPLVAFGASWEGTTLVDFAAGQSKVGANHKQWVKIQTQFNSKVGTNHKQ